MTAQQALRHERRRAVARMRRERRIEIIKGIAAILLALAVFCIAGTLDFQDEQSEISRWESQGITIARW